MIFAEYLSWKYVLQVCLSTSTASWIEDIVCTANVIAFARVNIQCSVVIPENIGLEKIKNN